MTKGSNVPATHRVAHFTLSVALLEPGDRIVSGPAQLQGLKITGRPEQRPDLAIGLLAVPTKYGLQGVPAHNLVEITRIVPVKQAASYTGSGRMRPPKDVRANRRRTA